MSKTVYIALIGDIQASRLLADRQATQTRLASAILNLNDRPEVRASMVSPLTITLGDEFQALFSSAAAIWEVVLGIESELSGRLAGEAAGVRFGIGIGSISTKLNKSAAIGMDGPAFHNARAAIETLKASGSHYGVAGVGPQEAFINSALSYISLHRSSWKPNRVAILDALLKHIPVADIAHDLGVSKVAVYKNIDQAGLSLILDMLQEAAKSFDQALERQV